MSTNLDKPIEYRHAAFDELRAQPGCRSCRAGVRLVAARPGYYALARLDDILYATRNPATFISGKGTAPPRTCRPSPRPVDDLDGRSPARRLRRIVSRGFTQDGEVAHGQRDPGGQEIVDDVIERGECDASRTSPRSCPAAHHCDMMGIAEKHHKSCSIRPARWMGVQDPEYVTEGTDAFGACSRHPGS